MDVIESRKKKNFETFSRSPQHMKNNQHNSVEENSRNRSQNNQILGGGIKSNIPVNGSDKRYGIFMPNFSRFCAPHMGKILNDNRITKIDYHGLNL